MEEKIKFAPDTLAVHQPAFKLEGKPVSCPIIQSSTFELENTAQGYEFSTSINPSVLYTRWGNPTTSVWERYMAQLEDAERALAFSSGMAAISTTLLAFLEPGDHVLAYRTLYSATTEFLNRYLRRLGITTTFVESDNWADYEKALTKDTKLIYVESPDNPSLNLVDLEAFGTFARKKGIISICDNTFATPICQNPLSLGIDIVVHSATKYLGGHSDVVAGCAVSKKEHIERIWDLQKLLGGCIDPHAAWLLIRGGQTLSVRMQKHCNNAMEVARFLQDHPTVENVLYPGLSSHPQHAIAQKQMKGGFGGMVSFTVRGGKEPARTVTENTQLIRLAVSLGGPETLIEHPASMTHAPLNNEELKTAGISPGQIRLSVGLENPADLIRDLDRALSKID